MMDEGLALMQRLFTERRVTHEGKYYAVQRHRDVSQAEARSRSRCGSAATTWRPSSAPRALATGWLPGWRPWPELAEWIKLLKDRAAALGRDPKEIEIAPQFSLTIAKTAEEAEKRYMASGLVAHRKSLAYTGRDLSKQVVANLVGSPDLIREKVEGLQEDRRRSRLRPDDPGRFDGRVRGSGGVVRQDGDVATTCRIA